MSTFREGQEVEVAIKDRTNFGAWRKAKIINELRWHAYGGGYYVPSSANDPTGWTHSDPCGKFTVQFPDGTRTVFDEEQIRAVSP